MIPWSKPAFLAQTDVPADTVSQAIMYCLLLLGLALAGMVAVYFIRRWAKQNDTTQPAAGFTFEDLRRMHREGKISDAEFKLTSGKIAAATKAQYLSPGPKSAAKPSGPRNDPKNLNS
jgi:hypothetical protein